jgi:phage tail-like protein
MIGLNDVLTMSSLPGPLAALMSRDADITFNFTVLVGGLPLGDFYAVDTFQRTVEPYVYKELGKNDSPRELVGIGGLGHVVLKWGLMNRSSLWDWMNEVMPLEDKSGEGFRRDVLILQMNRGKIPVRCYNLRGAFPVRWTGANLDAMSSTTAVEELELSYRKLEVTAIPLPF